MANDIRMENFLDIIFDTSKLAGSKVTRLRVCLFSFQCTRDQNDRYGWKCPGIMMKTLTEMERSSLAVLLLLQVDLTKVVFIQSVL